MLSVTWFQLWKSLVASNYLVLEAINCGPEAIKTDCNMHRVEKDARTLGTAVRAQWMIRVTQDKGKGRGGGAIHGRRFRV